MYKTKIQKENERKRLLTIKINEIKQQLKKMESLIEKYIQSYHDSYSRNSYLNYNTSANDLYLDSYVKKYELLKSLVQTIEFKKNMLEIDEIFMDVVVETSQIANDFFSHSKQYEIEKVKFDLSSLVEDDNEKNTKIDEIILSIEKLYDFMSCEEVINEQPFYKEEEKIL